MRVTLQQSDEIDRVNKEKEEQTHKPYTTRRLRTVLEMGKHMGMI